MDGHIYVHVGEMKEGRSKQGQTNNKAKQHSTPKAVTFLKKNKLPEVGSEPMTLHTLDRALYVCPFNGCCTQWNGNMDFIDSYRLKKK